MNGNRLTAWLVWSWLVWLVAVLTIAATCDLVGGRGQDSTVVATATSTASSSPALVPAPNDRAVGETVVGAAQSDLTDVVPRGWDSSSAAPASTVTQSALTATVQAYLVIDPVPATPPAQRVPVGSYAPWPEYLWPVVACLVQRESRGDPNAIGSAGERGLLQVHPITWPYIAGYGITPDGLFDPATNIRAGYLLYLEAGGLRPWGGSC